VMFSTGGCGFWTGFGSNITGAKSKPVQKPHPPVLVGGESDRALERAARLGDGWIRLHHTPASVALPGKKLRDHLGMYPAKRAGFTITCSGLANHPDEVQAWSDAGV